MREEGLITFSEAAEQFGVYRGTIADMTRKLGIEPKMMTNGMAKGLDRDDVRRIGEAFKGGEKAVKKQEGRANG